MAPSSSKAASTVAETVAPEQWLVDLQRKGLFDGIQRGEPFSLLMNFANTLYGSRGAPTTDLERAESELYSKLKNKADFAQLQKLKEKVLELEKKYEDDKNKNKKTKTNRDDAGYDDGDVGPVNKRARTSRKILPELDDSDDDLPPASMSKGRSISRPEDEPSRPKQTQQSHSIQKPKVDTALDDDDGIGYSSDDLDPFLKARKDKAMAEAELRRKVLPYENRLGIDPRKSSNNKKAATSKANARPGPNYNTSDDEDDDDYEEDYQPFTKRLVSIHNQRTPGQSIVRPADQPRTGGRGALGAPGGPVLRAAIRRDPAIQRDPNESNALAYRRAEVHVQARENEDLDYRPDSPPLPPRRAPAGRPSQDYDAPDDAAYTPQDSIDPFEKFRWKGGKKYRVVKPVPKFRKEDGTWKEEEEVMCLSDLDERDIEKPPQIKIKLNGWNGMPWDKKWDPVPDPEPRGAPAFAVPAEEVLLRRSVGALELSRHEGMEDGTGSEYIHAEGRRRLVPRSRGRDGRKHGSYRASPSVAGAGSVAISVVGGSNMGPPPSTINTVSQRYSVRAGAMVERTDSKHERGVTRTTKVDSMGVNRDTGVQRTLWQRLGRTEEGHPLEESIEQEPVTPIFSNNEGDGVPGRQHQPAARQLTITNVARLEQETGHPRTIGELVHKKLRPDGANPQAGDRAETESVYAATVMENAFGDVIHQTYRTRKEIDERQRAAYAAEREPRAAADDQFRPGGGDIADEQTRAVRREPTREELDAEERRRIRDMDGELETLGSLFAPSNASSAFGALDDYPEIAGSVAGSSISQREQQRVQRKFPQAARRAAPHTMGPFGRGWGGNGNGEYRGGGNRRGQRGGYRGGRGGGSQRGGGGYGGGQRGRGRDGYARGQGVREGW